MAEKKSKCKLSYFNARGRAEHIRYILACSGVDYIDDRVSKERWQELKKSVPYGMLPVFEEDGRVISQSNAIARYLARKHGLVGKDEWEATQCDVMVDTLGDLKQELLHFQKEDDLIKKEEKKAKFARETVPFYLNKFEKAIASNGGFAVGSSTTWADLVFTVALESFEQMFGPSALQNYPALRSLKQRVHSIPAIAAWISKRPHTSS